MNAHLVDCRNVWRQRGTLRRRNAECAQPPAFDVGFGQWQRRDHEVEPASQQIGHRGRGALVGNVDEVDVGALLEDLRGEVRRTSDPGRAVIQLVRIFGGGVDQAGDVLDRTVHRHDQRLRNGGHRRHGGDGGDVVTDLHHVGVHRDALGGELQRVSVGRGLRDKGRRDAGIGARPVLRNHGNLEQPLHLRRQRARGKIDGRTGSGADNHADRLIGIGRSLRRRRPDEGGRRQQPQQGRSAIDRRSDRTLPPTHAFPPSRWPIFIWPFATLSCDAALLNLNPETPW